MQIIAYKTLREYWSQKGNEKAEAPLQGWYDIAKRAMWKTTVEVKADFPQTDFLTEGRAIFDIGGNKFRLAAKIVYKTPVLFIKFVGNHREYDRWNKNGGF